MVRRSRPLQDAISRRIRRWCVQPLRGHHEENRSPRHDRWWRPRRSAPRRWRLGPRLIPRNFCPAPASSVNLPAPAAHGVMSAFPSDLKLVQGRLISAALAAALILHSRGSPHPRPGSVVGWECCASQPTRRKGLRLAFWPLVRSADGEHCIRRDRRSSPLVEPISPPGDRQSRAWPPDTSSSRRWGASTYPSSP